MLMLMLSFALATEGAPAGGVALRDLMVGMPACDARPVADPMLDVHNRCVDGLCPGTTLAQVTAVYGEPTRCSIPSISNTDICTFGTHLSVHLAPDSDKVEAIFLLADHQARTPDGLGIGSPLTCFVDRYGDQAISVDVKVKDGRLTWDHIHFRDPSILVSVDEQGLVEKIQLSHRSYRTPPRRR